MQHKNPALEIDRLYAQALKSWYTSLRDHDPRDLHGHLNGLICVLGLIVSRLPAGPRPAFTHDSSFEIKVERWRDALVDLLRCDRGTEQ